MPDTVQSHHSSLALPHTAATIMATGEPVKFYDMNAVPVPCAEDKAWPSVNDGNVWVRGEVDNDAETCAEMNTMLANGRVLAMAAGKGLVFQKKDDGNIIFYGVIPSALQPSKVGTID